MGTTLTHMTQAPHSGASTRLVLFQDKTTPRPEEGQFQDTRICE